MIKRLTLVSATLVVTTDGALAHPGEHVLGALQGLVHLLTEPDHLALIGVAAVLAYATWAWRKSKS
jgi:hydrogenase/urease accessory protein HupE